MSRTLVIAGKIGPAFNGGAMSGFGSVDYPMPTDTHAHKAHALDAMIEVIAGNVCEDIAWQTNDYVLPHEVTLGDVLDVLTR